jgi:Ca-activated chloride channel homolog
MKKALQAMAICLAMACGVSAPADAENSPERTLSPYFFIQSEDASTDRFPLRSTEVQADISGVIAEVTVRQRYTNDGGSPIHASYIFPASTRASVHGMVMTIGERIITAQIKEKAAARQTFEAAKREGKSASLLEQQRPNVFSMEVANILPGDVVDIELHYTELLVPTDGTYEFVYPTVVGPRYSNMPEAGAPRSEQWVQNPYLKQGEDPKTEFNITVNLSTGMPLQEVSCKTHDTDIEYRSESAARLFLVRPEDFGGDRDFILHYRLADKQIASGLLLHEGESENFFLLMVQPPERVRLTDIPDREYIFVVDVSGSMNGFPLNTAKDLLRDLIGGLRATDTFNVVLFAGGSTLMSPHSLPATPANIDQAIRVIDDQRGGGGTELLKAMNRALALPKDEHRSRSVLIVTDGYIHAEREVFEAIQENLNRTNVFAFGIGSSVNRFLIEGMAKSGQGEPFVVTGPGDAASKATKFREYVSAPVLTDIQVQMNEFETFDIEPPAIPDVFAQRPVILFGKWRGDRTGTITLSGMSGKGEYRKTFSVADTDPSPVNEPLRYLWARTRIARLSDFNPQKGDPENRAEILTLGLTYNLLTAYTSFVAVDEVVRNPEGKGEDVKQPLPLPKGVSNLAVGGTVNRVPEPDLILLAILAAGMMLGVHLRRNNRKRA